jgi:ketosteroid isomerase-like protein
VSRCYLPSWGLPSCPSPTLKHRATVIKPELLALKQHLMNAFNSRDASAIIAFYSDDPNAILFEETIPLQLDKAALRKANEMFFKSVSDFHGPMESVDVLVSADLGVVRSLIMNTWTDTNVAYIRKPAATLKRTEKRVVNGSSGMNISQFRSITQPSMPSRKWSPESASRWRVKGMHEEGPGEQSHRQTNAAIGVFLKRSRPR